MTHHCSVAQAFGLNVSETLQVPGAHSPGPLTPAINPDYRFRPSLLSDLLAWHKGRYAGQHHDGLWLSGPMGAGKSSLVQQTAARLNLNVVPVTAQRRLELADLIGHLTVIGGDMMFQDGPLTTALRRGWWLLINEADLMDPGELAGLNTVLDGGPLVIADNAGEVVHPMPGWGLICTANTVGLGDRDGLYVGTRRMNAAFLDRFWVVEVDYPEPDEEIHLISRVVPQLPRDLIRHMVEVAQEVRRVSRDESAVGITPFSTRSLVRWAYLAQQYRSAPRPLDHALKRALTHRAEPEAAEAIHGIMHRIIGEECDG